MTEKLKIFNRDGSVTEVEPLKMWTPDLDACPHCGIPCDLFKPPHFVPDAGGVSYVAGEPSVHWVSGTQKCPCCGHEWYLSDSE